MMQGDVETIEGISFEYLDENKIKCYECDKVLHKMLIKPHASSHTNSLALKKPLEKSLLYDPRPKGVKKVGLGAGEIDGMNSGSVILSKNIEPAAEKPLFQVPKVYPNAQQKYVNLELPSKINKSHAQHQDQAYKKHKSEKLIYYIKKYKICEFRLLRVQSTYARCVFLIYLRYFRAWKVNT
jgi:hypothetical protein